MKKIKVGDTVQMMRGKDAGKQGKVLRVVVRTDRKGANSSKAIVEGVNKIKKHTKPNPSLNVPGGIVEYEAPVDLSNLMYVENGKPTRIGFKVDDKTGKKIRISKKSGKEI